MSDDNDVRPNVVARVPICSREECPSFDGKRCRVTGFRPDGICEPAVVEMADRILALEAKCDLLAASLKQRDREAFLRGWEAAKKAAVKRVRILRDTGYTLMDAADAIAALEPPGDEGAK